MAEPIQYLVPLTFAGESITDRIAQISRLSYLTDFIAFHVGIVFVQGLLCIVNISILCSIM